MPTNDIQCLGWRTKKPVTLVRNGRMTSILNREHLKSDTDSAILGKMATSWETRHPCIDEAPYRKFAASLSSDTLSRHGLGKYAPILFTYIQYADEIRILLTINSVNFRTCVFSFAGERQCTIPRENWRKGAKSNWGNSRRNGRRVSHKTDTEAGLP